jgi:hypothetical protein
MTTLTANISHCAQSDNTAAYAQFKNYAKTTTIICRFARKFFRYIACKKYLIKLQPFVATNTVWEIFRTRTINNTPVNYADHWTYCINPAFRQADLPLMQVTWTRIRHLQ